MDAKQECQYSYSNMVQATSPDLRTALPLRRQWWNLKTIVWYTSILGPRKAASKMLLATRLRRLAFKRKQPSYTRKESGKAKVSSINLQPGDWVEVRSAKEIFSTLDGKGKNRGLGFTREMEKFCGRRFRVYKNLRKIILEATGELRTMKVPTLLLEGVTCDGEFHGGCDKSCFCFWREIWLKRIPSAISEDQLSEEPES